MNPGSKKSLVIVAVLIGIFFVARDFIDVATRLGPQSSNTATWKRETLLAGLSAEFPTEVERQWVRPPGPYTPYQGGSFICSWDRSKVNLRITEEVMPEIDAPKDLIMEAMLTNFSAMGEIVEQAQDGEYLRVKLLAKAPNMPDHYMEVKLRIGENFAQRAMAVYPVDYTNMDVIDHFLSSVTQKAPTANFEGGMKRPTKKD